MVIPTLAAACCSRNLGFTIETHATPDVAAGASRPGFGTRDIEAPVLPSARLTPIPPGRYLGLWQEEARRRHAPRRLSWA